MNYDEIIGFAKEKHGNQKRRGGELYFYHVKEVGELAKEIAYQMSDKYHFTEEEIELMQYAGFLHDTIEDTTLQLMPTATLMPKQLFQYLCKDT